MTTIKQLQIHELLGLSIESFKTFSKGFNDNSSQFMRYHFDDYVINVESTAKQLTAAILKMDIDLQIEFFAKAAGKIADPGEQADINETGRHGARLVRLASDDSKVINFLLTH